MRVLIITDGVFNDYSRLDELSLGGDDIFVFVSSEDKNKIDEYFNDKYENVHIIKQLSSDFDKIFVLRIHEQSETPYENIKDKGGFFGTYICKCTIVLKKEN